MALYAQAGEPPAAAEWRPVVDAMASQIPDAPGPGLAPDLHEACAAAWSAARECKRLLLGVPFLLHDRESYRGLAARVHEAVGRAQRAHSRVDVRLRPKGGRGASAPHTGICG